MAVRVDDDGNESKSGKNLRIGIGTAPSEEKSVVNAVTIMNFDFAVADEGYCFGMQFGGYGEEVLEKVIGEVEPTVYADTEEDMFRLKVKDLTGGRSVMAWLVDREDGKSYIQVRIVGSAGELGEIKAVMAFGGGSENINEDVGYDLCATSDGGFAVVWQDKPSSSDDERPSYLKLRRFDSLGEYVGAEEVLKEGDSGFNDNNIRVSSVGELGKLVILYNLDAGLSSHNLYVTERYAEGNIAERLIVSQEGLSEPISGEILGLVDDSYVWSEVGPLNCASMVM